VDVPGCPVHAHSVYVLAMPAALPSRA
jgi:hypothetical protein